jgi:hypothetical protein
MKYLKGSHSTQHIKGLIATIVDSIVRVLIEYVKDGNEKIFAKISIGILSKDNSIVKQNFTLNNIFLNFIWNKTFISNFKVLITGLANLVDMIG